MVCNYLNTLKNGVFLPLKTIAENRHTFNSSGFRFRRKKKSETENSTRNICLQYLTHKTQLDRRRGNLELHFNRLDSRLV